MTDNELKAWLMAYKDGDKIPDNMGYRVIRLLQILISKPKTLSLKNKTAA